MTARRYARRAFLVAYAAAAAVAASAAPVAAAGDRAVTTQALRVLPGLRTLDAYGPYVNTEQAFHYHDFIEAYLPVMRASIPPERRRYNDWLTLHGGLMPDLIIVQQAGGKAVLWTQLCMPHNCSENTMHILYAPGSSAVWGYYRIDRGVGVLGTPSIAQRALFLAIYAARFSSIRNQFTLPLDAKELHDARSWIARNGTNPAQFFSR